MNHSSAEPLNPQVSVILVVAEQFHTIRRTLRHLRQQAAREQIELVLVGPSEAALVPLEPGELEGFARVTPVIVGPIQNVDRAAARGALQASAPVVAFIEDHVYPEAGWAGALIEAHQEPWGAVGSVMLNANPDSMLSWANLLIAYGHWVAPTRCGPVEALPGHNISYKRSLLARYGERLEEQVGRESRLHEELRATGHDLYLAPDARIAHANPSRPLATAALRFQAGRLYGAQRAEQNRWGVLRRLLYFLGGLLIPLVRFWRFRRQFFGEGQRDELVPRVFPALLYALFWDAVGQMAGYLIGSGGARQWLAEFEFERLRHLTRRDRALLNE